LRKLELSEEQQVIIALAATLPEFGLMTYNSVELPGASFFDSLQSAMDPTRNPGQINDSPGLSKSSNYLQMSWRVFDGFESYGISKVKAGSVEQRKVAINALEKLAMFQVNQAFDMWKGIVKLEKQINELGDDREVMENVKEQMKMGLLTRLAYRDTLMEQTRKQFAKDQIRYQKAVAMVALQRALGLGIEFEGTYPWKEANK